MKMKKKYLLSIVVFFPIISLAKENTIEQNFNFLYEKNSQIIDKKSDTILLDNYKISKEDIIKNEGVNWLKYNLESYYYIEKGFLSQSKDSLKESNKFLYLLDNYTENYENKRTDKNDFVFNYIEEELNNRLPILYNNVLNCKNEKNLKECTNKLIPNKDRVFSSIIESCFNKSSTQKILECRLNFIREEKFKKQLFKNYYNLGVQLYLKNNK